MRGNLTEDITSWASIGCNFIDREAVREAVRPSVRPSVRPFACGNLLYTYKMTKPHGDNLKERSNWLRFQNCCIFKMVAC